MKNVGEECIMLYGPADIVPLLQKENSYRHFVPLIRISQPTLFLSNFVG